MKQIAFLFSLALIFVIPWENSVQISGIGTISRLVGLITAAVWFLAVVIEGRLRRPSVFLAITTTFVGWSALSVFWSVDPTLTVKTVKTLFQLLIFTFVIWDLYPTANSIRAGMQAYVLGAWVAITSILLNFLTGTTAHYSRYSVQGFNADDAGLILAIGMPIAWGLGVRQTRMRRNSALKFLNFAYFPLAFLGIALTGTRMALIATLPAILFAIFSLTRLSPRRRLTVGVLAVAGVLSIAPLVPQTSIERFLTTGSEIATGSLSGRGYIWKMGVQTFTQHPLLGVGAGAFRPAVGIDHVAHNTFLSILTELGILGIALFLGIVGVAVAHSFKHPPAGVRFWLTILMIWGLGALTLTLEVRKVTWLVLPFAAVSGAVQQKPKCRLEPTEDGYRVA